ncbi:MAG: hypothetical protein IIX47_05115, partial [Spirochaetaceae bacterium]|nr:hypothetical protein [Spirochaetaceae bacterium]
MLSSLFFVGCKEVAGYDNFGTDYFIFCICDIIAIACFGLVFSFVYDATKLVLPVKDIGICVSVYVILSFVLAYIFENPGAVYVFVQCILCVAIIVIFWVLFAGYKVEKLYTTICLIVGCCILVAVTYIYKLTQNGKEVFALTFAGCIPLAVALIASRKIDKRFIPLSFLSLPVIGLIVLQTHRGIPTNIYLISIMLCVVPFCIVFLFRKDRYWFNTSKAWISKRAYNILTYVVTAIVCVLISIFVFSGPKSFKDIFFGFVNFFKSPVNLVYLGMLCFWFTRFIFSEKILKARATESNLIIDSILLVAIGVSYFLFEINFISLLLFITQVVIAHCLRYLWIPQGNQTGLYSIYKTVYIKNYENKACKYLYTLYPILVIAVTMFLNLTTGEYLKPLVYSLVGWLPMISSIFGLKRVKNKKLTITFFINGIFNILVMIFAVFKIREGFQNVEYITAIQLGIITLAYYFIASQKKQTSDSVHFYINLNVSTILLWGFVVFSIFFAPNESFIEELIFNGIGFGIISVIILIVSGITYSCNLTKFKIKKAKEAKEKAEREAREAKEKAEREAREKKEKAAQKAREKKEKAEREAREAKEKAEREAQEAKEKAELLSRIKNIDGDVNKAKKAIAEKISEEKNAIEKIKQEIKQIEEQIAKTPNTGMGLVNKAKFSQQKTELEKSIDYTKIQVLEEKNKQLLDLFNSIKELDNKTKNE